MTPGERVRHFRNAAGITQKELAGRIGVKQGAVGNWEAGTNAPTHANLCAVADALGVKHAEFFGLGEQTSEQPPEAA